MNYSSVAYLSNQFKKLTIPHSPLSYPDISLGKYSGSQLDNAVLIFKERGYSRLEIGQLFGF